MNATQIIYYLCFLMFHVRENRLELSILKMLLLTQHRRGIPLEFFSGSGDWLT